MHPLGCRGAAAHERITLLFSSRPCSTRPWSCLKRVARPSRSGSSSTTCATGSWCGALPISAPGKWPTSTQTCWARRAAGQRCGVVAAREGSGTSSASLRSQRKRANWAFWLSFSGHVCLHESCVPQHAARQWGQAVWRGRGGALQVIQYWYFFLILAQTVVPVLAEFCQLSLQQSTSASECIFSYSWIYDKIIINGQIMQLWQLLTKRISCQAKKKKKNCVEKFYVASLLGTR